MANAEHLAILRKGREVWDRWREEYPEVIPDLTKADLRGMYFGMFNLDYVDLQDAEIVGDSDLDEPDENGYGKLQGYNPSSANFTQASLRGANLSGLSFSNLDDSYPDRDLKSVDLRGADLTEAKLCGAYIRGARLGELIIESSNWHLAEVLIEPYRYERREIPTKLKGANLARACLDNVNLNNLDLSGANLAEASLIETQVLGTDFRDAIFTGACLQDWHINSATKLDGVKCDYVYLKLDWSKERKHYLSERRPSSGVFAPGEFTQLFQETLETVDLIFRRGLDWKAFAYTFRRIELEHEGEYLSIRSIENKGDGVVVVKVGVSPNADKAQIHNDFVQGYEFARQALEAQYQARITDNDKHINQLFALLQQAQEKLGEVPRLMAENPNRIVNTGSGNYVESNSGTYVQGNYTNMSQDLTQAASQIQELLRQLQEQGNTVDIAQQKVAEDLANQATSSPTAMGKLVKWGQSLADTASKTSVSEAAKIVVTTALRLAGVPLP